MAKAGEISGKISSISDYSNNRNFYMPVYNQRKRKEIASPIRKGEIVSGTILTDANNSIASVRLPVGILDAKLHNNLKKGDRLFFKVTDEKPVLTLKVHSVNTIINGIRLSNKEIVRILDLTDDELNENIIKVLSDQNSIIVKDSILKIINNFSLLPERILEGKRLLPVIKTIYWMNEANIEFNYRHFELLYPAFRGLKYLNYVLRDFQLALKKQSNSLTEKTLKILDLINSEFQFSFFASFYSKKTDSGMLLFNNIKDLERDSSIISEIKKIAKDIEMFINAIHKWNAIADIKTVPYHLYMPLPNYYDDYTNAQLIIQNYKSINIETTVKIEDDDPDCDLGARLLRYEPLAFSFDLFEKNNSEEILKELATNVRTELLNYNLSLQAFIVHYEGSDRDFLPDFPKSPSHKISVVI